MGHSAEPTVIVTGALSSVGLHAAKSLAERGWHVVMACRNPAKVASVAASVGMVPGRFTIMALDLGSQQNMCALVANFRSTALPLHALDSSDMVEMPR